jgi:hypothetical protein
MEKSTKTFRSHPELTVLTGSAPRDSTANPTAVDFRLKFRGSISEALAELHSTDDTAICAVGRGAPRRTSFHDL